MTKVFKPLCLVFCLIMLATSLSVHCQNQFGWQPDNKNGTYTNPIQWMDSPDPDVVKVGSDFFMVTTSMHMVPGCPIYKSKDLINWELVGYALNDLTNIDIKYNLDGGSGYGAGAWAASIKYHNNTFYVAVNIQGKGFMMLTAPNPEGPWTKTSFGYFHDPGLFFDDDGKVYLSHGSGDLNIVQLNPDAKSTLGNSSIIFNGSIKYPGLEGSRLYKIRGKYYVMCTFGGGAGKQLCLRSDNLYGPYEEMIVLDSDGNYPALPDANYSVTQNKGVHQGNLIKLDNEEWWSMIFQDRIYPGSIGRVPTLQPVFWKNDWPYLGRNGQAVFDHIKPRINAGTFIPKSQTSDEFNDTKLALQWQWNHNPDNNRWSLTEKPGSIRIKSCNATNDFYMVRNILTQKTIGPEGIGTTEMDISGLQNGTVAGLCLFHNPYAYIGVKRENNVLKLVMVNNGTTVIDKNISGNTIWLRAKTNMVSNKATFEYSLDSFNYLTFGNEFTMQYDLKHFVGYRFALFCQASSGSLGGFADFNWFHFDSPTRNLPQNARLQAEHFASQSGVQIEKCSDAGMGYDVGFIENNDWIKFDTIDFGSGANYFNFRIATPSSGGTIEIHKDGIDGILLATAKIGTTGAWDAWQTVTSALSVPLVGRNVIALKFTGPSGFLFNLNWSEFNFKKQVYTYSNKIPGIIEAENYDDLGEGVGFHDNTQGNLGGEYRNDDVDIESTKDSSAGYNVGWSQPGEWLVYTTTVESDGHYDFVFRSASAGGGQVSLQSNNTDVVRNIKIPATGDWQKWENVIIRNIPLNKGIIKLKLLFESPDVNINYIKTIPSSSITSIEDFKDISEFNFYPNPTTGIININGKGAKIKIFNYWGVVVLESVLNETNQLDLSSNENGVYIAQITKNDLTFYRKFFIIK